MIPNKNMSCANEFNQDTTKHGFHNLIPSRALAFELLGIAVTAGTWLSVVIYQPSLVLAKHSLYHIENITEQPVLSDGS